MWFLWCFITFLVVVFSSSQIVSYLVCFLRYPEMMEDINNTDKKVIIGGIVLHGFINILWLILVCVIPAIREHWIAILIVFIVCLFISVYGVRQDQNLKHNFGEVTGYNKRKKLEEELNQIVEQYKKIMPQDKNVNDDQDTDFFD